jgi:hypothetical protein
MDKPPIEVIEPQKGLYFSYSPRSFLILYNRNLFRINFNTIYKDNKAKIFYIYNIEFALLNIRLKACILELLKDLFYIEFIF